MEVAVVAVVVIRYIEFGKLNAIKKIKYMFVKSDIVLIHAMLITIKNLDIILQ